MARIDGFGIAVDLPRGFEGEIFNHTPAMQMGPTRIEAFSESPEPPVAHIATFPLPPDRGDFGNGAVDTMGTEDIFVALCEYDSASAASPLFAAEGFPRLRSEDFSRSTLHRSFPNHSGCQRFFHVGDRAFCLYIVLGSHTFRSSLVRRVNEVIDHIELSSR